MICRFIYRIKIAGTQNVPKSGGFILASNHRAYFDPPMVGSFAGRVVGFMAKKELFAGKFLGWFLVNVHSIPIRRGTIDRRATELCLEMIKSGMGLTIFPEGTRSLNSEFLDPKPGIGMIASQANCPIVPCYIHGSNKLQDCRKGKDRLSISYGEPLSAEWIASQGDTKEGYYEIANTVMERIKELADHRPT